MNTAHLKRFATEARNKIKQGVKNTIDQWGFDTDGKVREEPQPIQNGMIFRGQLYNDAGVYPRWQSLKKRIDTVGLKQVCEEAAYTWFNRLVAIKILSKNELLEPYLDYVSETDHTTNLVNQAHQGILPLMMQDVHRRRVMDIVSDYQHEDELFSLLLTTVCHTTPILQNCFGHIDDYTELLLPRSVTANGDILDMLNDSEYITDEDYRQPELIGWLYQFYISERKDEVFASFKSGKKAAAEDIPAATQIFTPNWIVKYMVQNTIGRIYLDKYPKSTLKQNWKYLVEPSEPTADEHKLKFNDLEDLKVGDLAAGSGHILVEEFNILYDMYIEQYASPMEACEAIFKYNITGVDIDTRAMQLAKFALLMTACRKEPSMKDCHVMPMVYDMPDPLSEEVMMSLDDSLPHFFLGGTSEVKMETIKVLNLLQQAKDLGSVMKFDISETTRFAIEKALTNTSASNFPYYRHLCLLMALTEQYSALVMNPPYMGSGNMNEVLSKYVKENYPRSKADLMSVFMDVDIERLVPNGKYGMINMHSWMFLSSFEELRRTLIKEQKIDSLLHLGPRTFDELSGEVVQNAAFVVTKADGSSAHGTYYRLVDGKNCANKERMFFDALGDNGAKVYYPNVEQKDFEKIPGCPLGYWVSGNMIELLSSSKTIGSTFESGSGLSTSDNNRFLRLVWEVDSKKTGDKWYPFQKGGEFRKWYGNLEYVVNWENDGEEIKFWVTHNPKDPKTTSWSRRIFNTHLYLRDGITWSVICSGDISFRYSTSNSMISNAAGGIFGFEDNEEMLFQLIGALNSKIWVSVFNILNPTINFSSGIIQEAPLPLLDSNVGELAKDNVEISKKDWDAHETSCDFQTNELIRVTNGQSVTIDDCVKAYCAEWESNFDTLHKNEVELNRQFIDIYGLQDELYPDVPLDEITILQQGEISIVDNEIKWHDDVLIKQLLSYAVGVWMGRYRLDIPGLHIAHPEPTPEEVCKYTYRGEELEIDDDGIIPILPDEAPFSDNARKRMVDFMRIAFGAESLADNINFVERALGKSLSDYMIKDFWKDHKKMYQNRPIYWLFSSKKGAFQCICYMHRMNKFSAERVRQKYLLPYMTWLKDKIEQMQNQQGLSTVEARQLKKYETDYAECQEYHDRLHQTSQQNIEFDLDDGVVVNYAKFGDVLAKLK